MSLYPPAILRALCEVGSPYKFGAKWTPGQMPLGPVDCSGFSRWVLNLAGIAIPEGSYNQVLVCSRLPDDQQGEAPALSLGFYATPLFPAGGGSPIVDHVVVSCGRGVVVEARGEPYNCVILTPARRWLDQPGFLGFYAPPAPQG